MTLITITTIGYGEIRPLSDAGRVFTSVLIVVGIGTAATALTTIGSLIFESRVGAMFGRKKMDERIRKLSGHYLVCGFGDLGAAVAAELDRAGVPFVVVDADEEAGERARTLGFPLVRGDPTADSVLVAAGIRRAAGMAICSGDLPVNLMASMAGRELNPALHIIALGSDPAMEERLLRAGADTVAYPLKLGGQKVARLIVEQAGVTPDDQAESGEPSVLGYRVKLYRRMAAGTAGTSVGDIVARAGAVEAVSLRRTDGTELERPDPATPVGDGDALALLVREGRTRSAMECPAWTDDMSVGVASIDEEHRALLSLIGRIAEASAAKSPRSETAAIFDRLIEYTEGHFRHEEKLFRELGYPKAAEHEAEHRRLTNQVLELNRDRSAVLPENVTDFLLDWLTVHIMGSDHDYVEFFASKGLR